MKRIVVGLTGGIASGKSTVLNCFKNLGARTLDSDSIAMEVVRSGQRAYKKIISQFGSGILHQDGTINRKRLGEIVFKNSKKRRLLESIVHPEVVKRLQYKIDQSASVLLVIDIPLLFEAHLQNLVDKTVTVWIPKYMQLERLRLRNSFTLVSAKRRIESQWPLRKKCRMADFVVDNSGSLLKTKTQVCAIFSLLTKNL